MDLNHFLELLQNRQPDAGLSPQLESLWYDRKGDWEQSHELIQDLPDAGSARIHAYLHRKEGDQANALYWYRRAGVRPFTGSLEQEWEQLVKDL